MGNNWVITKDHINDGKNEVGTASVGYDSSRLSSMVVRFKAYDDDDNLYFEGLMEEEDLHPLDDFCMPGYGCTYIKAARPGKKFRII